MSTEGSNPARRYEEQKVVNSRDKLYIISLEVLRHLSRENPSSPNHHVAFLALPPPHDPCASYKRTLLQQGQHLPPRDLHRSVINVNQFVLMEGEQTQRTSSSFL